LSRVRFQYFFTNLFCAYSAPDELCRRLW